MVERREKILWFGCNGKWSRGHKYQETKFFTLEKNDDEEIETPTQMV